MMMFSNVMLVASLLFGESAHVLILTPFVVPIMMLSLTRSPFTSFSFGYLPKLPTLKYETKNHIKCNFLRCKTMVKTTERVTDCLVSVF